jgi:hypothetical protein
MAERIEKFEKELEALEFRKKQLLFTSRTEENASHIADELLSISKEQAALNDRMDKELARRDKIDKIGIPILLLSIVLFVIFAIITVIRWISLSVFPAVVGTIAIVMFASAILTVLVMKILNPDMKLF